MQRNNILSLLKLFIYLYVLGFAADTITVALFLMFIV